MPSSKPGTRADVTAFQASLGKVWADASPDLPGGDWMTQLRREALSRVMRDGLPGRRDEWWRYADLANLVPAALPVQPLAPAADAVARHVCGDEAWSITIRNGRVVKLPTSALLPDGVEVMRLAEALDVPSLWLRPWLQPSGAAIQNLNLAFATDGVLVRIARNAAPTRPVVIQSDIALAAGMVHERSVIALEEGARLTLVEDARWGASTQSLATRNISISLGQGACLTHVRLCEAGADTVAVQSCDVQLSAGASYRHVTLEAGARLLRHQVTVNLAGEGAGCDLAMAYAARAGSQVDEAVELRHTAPRTQSRLLVKGMAAKAGRGVAQGRVVVDAAAQGTDSHQMARGLLLEEGGEIFHKPELEIYADDVKCGHGATIASLDPAQLFYLQSRAIPAQEATAMLLAAFVREVVDRAPDAMAEPLAAWADRVLLAKEIQS